MLFTIQLGRKYKGVYFDEIHSPNLGAGTHFLDSILIHTIIYENSENNWY